MGYEPWLVSWLIPGGFHSFTHLLNLYWSVSSETGTVQCPGRETVRLPDTLGLRVKQAPLGSKGFCLSQIQGILLSAPCLCLFFFPELLKFLLWKTLIYPSRLKNVKVTVVFPTFNRELFIVVSVFLLCFMYINLIAFTALYCNDAFIVPLYIPGKNHMLSWLYLQYPE